MSSWGDWSIERLSIGMSQFQGFYFQWLQSSIGKTEALECKWPWRTLSYSSKWELYLPALRTVTCLRLAEGPVKVTGSGLCCTVVQFSLCPGDNRKWSESAMPVRAAWKWLYISHKDITVMEEFSPWLKEQCDWKIGHVNKWQNWKKTTITLSSLVTTVNASVHLHSTSSKNEKACYFASALVHWPILPSYLSMPSAQACEYKHSGRKADTFLC